ncbi:MAG TPA: pyridoxamine 5'-phosphate oxidase family protein [Syntrophorhabdaceae bacterium]|nr:pyridoxamine 5'-phosphate oxidase family protein [Syntrophorhabdaceae bacterium]
MEEVYEYLKKCGMYFIATVDGDQPRVRPFGSLLIFEKRLYFQTGKVKNVAKQLAKNPKIEICAIADRKWIRIEAIAVEDDRMEARQAMLDAHPQLKGMYAADDGNCEVFYLKNATATFSARGEEPRVVKF